MHTAVECDTIRDFLGSVAKFATAAARVLEDEPLRQVFRGRLTHSQLKLLSHVAAAEGCTIGDVAAVLHVTSAAAGKAVEKLVHRRLLRRSGVESDRRSSALALTETSRRLLAAYDDARNRRMDNLFVPLSVDDLRRTADLLRRLADTMSDHHVELQPR